MTLSIREYSWQLAPRAVQDIRRQVFIQEQAVPEALEWDDSDEIALHFVAVDASNTPVAVARLIPALAYGEKATIGRMAVLPEYRGKGIGEQLLHHLMARAAEDTDYLALSAQERAIDFYRKHGFHVCSGLYDDAGIPHVDMRCFAPDLVLDAGDRERPTLVGFDEDIWPFHSDNQASTMLDTLVAQAHRRLWLYDHELAPELYDRQRLTDLMSALARHHRHSEIRLLIHDDRHLIERRHRLVRLMQRLPSSIELRLINPSYPAPEEPFAIVDRYGLAVRRDFSVFEGWAGFNHAGHVKRLTDQFEQLWETASPSLELRQLPL